MMPYGIFTRVNRTEEKPVELEEYDDVLDFYGKINLLADSLGWPDEWIICPHCSAYSWRLPPHVFEACPILVEMTQSAGLKMDAERTAAIRSGITMEKQFEALQNFLENLGEEEE